jgi:flagellar hook-associated protein 3
MSGWGTILSTTRAALRLQGQELQRLQEMASSGARVIRPSDSPVDAFNILQARAASQTTDAYLRNIDSVTASIEMANSVLQSFSSSLARVRTLAAQAASGTYSDQDRATMAREVDSILEQVIAFANTSQGGRYLFGGGRTDGAPYESVIDDYGRITGVSYVGSRDRVPVPVAGGVEYGTVLVGDEVFRSDDRQVPRFFGRTDIQPGRGTSTIRGDAWLTITHTATTYLGASGVMQGDSSAADDTIVGTAHTLTIDAAGKTIQLDDGEVVTYTGTETDLRLTNSTGDAVYVRTTDIAPAFQGTVNIRADGELSLDGGANTSPITFSENDAIQDSDTGRVLYVNTSSIDRTGLEPVRVPGTYDTFTALVNLRDAMLNQDGLPSGERAALMSEAARAVTEVGDRLTGALTTTGAQLQALGDLKDNLTSMQSSTDQYAATLQNADIADVAIELASRQTLYEMTLASTAKLLSLSLLDYLD